MQAFGMRKATGRQRHHLEKAQTPQGKGRGSQTGGHVAHGKQTRPAHCWRFPHLSSGGSGVTEEGVSP